MRIIERLRRSAWGLAAAGCLAAAIANSGSVRAAASQSQTRKGETVMSDSATTAGSDQPQSLNVKVGDKAPDFSLPMYPSGTFKLSDYRGKQAVVLYFYPKDDTPGCTKEACTFRDTHGEFGKAGAAIFGVSQDSLDSHKAFTDKFSLPFPLLVDEGDKVRLLYGMPDPQVPLHARVTYVIDKQGVVRHIIGAGPDQIEVEEHITQALEWVKKLAAEDQGAA
jgi:peroxiredoxin Q/BCP